MHPQTLRQYDRIGLVIPKRTKGRGRRYSAEDIAELREIQRLSQEEGINLAGIKRLLELRRDAARLAAENQRLRQRLAVYERGRGRVFSAAPTGEVSPLTKFPLTGSAGAGTGSLSARANDHLGRKSGLALTIGLRLINGRNYGRNP